MFKLMKKLLSICVLLMIMGAQAQYIQSNGDNHSSNAAKLHNTDKESQTLINDDSDGFAIEAKKNNIAYRTFQNLQNVPNGYYTIVGAYAEKQNRVKHIRKLEKSGFESGVIENPHSSLSYIYNAYYPDWKQAIEDCKTQFEGRYKETVWILNATNKELTNDNVSLESVTYELLTASTTKDNDVFDEESGSIQNNTTTGKSRGNVSKSKLLQAAEANFDKMWYAEAARFYELALSKDKDVFSSGTLQRAGDAHYFSGNIERANHWYNLRYEKYQDDFSADDIFKYTHTLKGAGKYARAKKLTRIYNGMGSNLDDDELISTPTANEIVLDKILETNTKFDIKNLSINSEYSEFSPMFYGEEQVVFSSAKDTAFLNTRRFKWNNQPFLDLYVAKINEESQELKDALKFSKKINSKYHEASVTFSSDNSTMYFTRNNFDKKLKRDKNGTNHLKIYTASKINGEWTEPKELPFNSDSYSTGHPALSPDGKQLYFVSDMPGSIGSTDIFVVDVLENGEFSSPRNLGPEINTKGREMFPFVNNKKIYFSSDGHVGLGGLDIYEATFTENGLTEVKNLGQPINSEKDDFSYIVKEETQMGYFASNRLGGKGDDDLYSFRKLVLEEVEENLNAISGVITEQVTGNVMPKALVLLLDENNIKLKELYSDDNGKFVFEDLDNNTKYNIKIVTNDYFESEHEVYTKNNENVSLAVSLKHLKDMIAVENGIRKLKTDMIHFDFDKYNIRNDAAQELDKLVEVMTQYKDMVIRIESHTDSWGDSSYNKYLSDKRAKSTREYLISRGISNERIESAVGYGEERLLNECVEGVPCSREKHKLNRRSEFIIVKM